MSNFKIQHFIQNNCTFTNGLTTILLLIIFLLIFIFIFYSSTSNKFSSLPGPKPWPILGSLHLMDGHKIPFAAFTHLIKTYGKLFRIRLGSVDCVIVNDEVDMKEVVSTKGHLFDYRPDFKRFAVLFGGKKQNSLAFCDNDIHQKAKRKMIKVHAFPQSMSENWKRLDTICQTEAVHMINCLSDKGEKLDIDIKPILLKSCANIFSNYFCHKERSDYKDTHLSEYVQNFDEIFWEVNNGRAMDFMPWLFSFMGNTLNNITKTSHKIRSYVIENIAKGKKMERSDRLAQGTYQQEDLLDSLMDNIGDDENMMNDEEMLYALEDMLGGHTAVANITLRILYDIARHQDVQTQMRQEVADMLGSKDYTLEDRPGFDYSTATMQESIRMCCSAIVPHMARENTTIAGHNVKAGTVIFINNHHMNMNTENWEEPEKYNPSRFVGSDGTFKMPSFYHPFSYGRRSCLGHKLVNIVAFSLLINILRNFNVTSKKKDIPLGMLALEPQPFYLTLEKLTKILP